MASISRPATKPLLELSLAGRRQKKIINLTISGAKFAELKFMFVLHNHMLRQGRLKRVVGDGLYLK